MLPLPEKSRRRWRCRRLRDPMTSPTWWFFFHPITWRVTSPDRRWLLPAAWKDGCSGSRMKSTRRLSEISTARVLARPALGLAVLTKRFPQQRDACGHGEVGILFAFHFERDVTGV